MHRAAAVTVLCSALCVTPHVAAQSTDASPADSATVRLTTAEFQAREPGTAVLYDLLRLPEFITRLVLTPTFPLIWWADSVALDERVTDSLSNEEHTAWLLPTASLFGRDAFGVGLRYTHSDLFGDQEHLALAASVRTNADRTAEFRYAQPLALLDRGWIDLHVSHDYDHNQRYYGIGPNTTKRDGRALLVDATRARLGLDLGGSELGAAGFQLQSGLGYLRRREGPGSDRELAPADPSDAPPGFEIAHHYAELGEKLIYDHRDRLGRTDSGWLLELAGDATKDLSGANLSAAGATTQGTLFIGLAPGQRVLVLHGGTEAVAPWNSSDRIPTQALVSLGRDSHLRGYPQDRFHDRVDWWSSVEYRYPIFDYGPTGPGASSTLFFDVGQIAGSYGQLPREPVRYSYGFGLRADTLSAMVLRLQLGLSREGAELTLSLNEAYE